MDQAQLFAGTAVADITPPLEVGLLTSSVNGLYEPFELVRLPLKARILVLKSGAEMVALVSVDLLALNDTSVNGWDRFKAGMSGIVSPDNIILTCTHTHNAPESVALSGLYLTDAYQNWLSKVQSIIKQAISDAFYAIKACMLSLAYNKLNDYSMQRRIKTPDGIVMSDSIQPIDSELFNLEPVDRRVKIMYFNDEKGNGIAAVVQATCHPVHEMCMKHVSSEFPGEMCRELELSPKIGMPLFLNGAAGDINPPTVSMGPSYAHDHGLALASLVRQNQHKDDVDTLAFGTLHSSIQFPVRAGSGVTNKLDAMARFSVVRIGSLAIVFLPGEPFIETALHIEIHSPFANTIVAGYGENNIGYIPTAKALKEGGYEAGPGKWSFMEEGADRLICTEALRLLNKLFNQNKSLKTKRE